MRICGFGYKIIYPLPKKSPSDYTVFCIGESTTWGIGAKNPSKDRYPVQLENLLNEHCRNKTIKCYFDETIGQNTSEILLKLPEYIKIYQPQIIILMTGINNWWNMDKNNIFIFNKNSMISENALRIYALLNKFRIWRLYKIGKLSLGLYKERWNFYHDEDLYRNKATKSLHQSKSETILTTTAEKIAVQDISEMIKICKANNIKVIVASYPRGGGFLYLQQRHLAHKLGVLFVDNHGAFKNLADLHNYLAEDFWHPNEKGYALVANNIARCIIENELIR